MLYGRNAAVDLLRASGMEATEALEALRESSNRTTREPRDQPIRVI